MDLSHKEQRVLAHLRAKQGRIITVLDSRRACGMSESTFVRTAADLRAKGLIKSERSMHGTIYTVLDAPETGPVRVERHVCPRTGACINVPIALTTHGFTAWGARA